MTAHYIIGKQRRKTKLPSHIEGNLALKKVHYCNLRRLQNEELTFFAGRFYFNNIRTSAKSVLYSLIEYGYIGKQGKCFTITGKGKTALIERN